MAVSPSLGIEIVVAVGEIERRVEYRRYPDNEQVQRAENFRVHGVPVSLMRHGLRPFRTPRGDICDRPERYPAAHVLSHVAFVEVPVRYFRLLPHERPHHEGRHILRQLPHQQERVGNPIEYPFLFHDIVFLINSLGFLSF